MFPRNQRPRGRVFLRLAPFRVARGLFQQVWPPAWHDAGPGDF